MSAARLLDRLERVRRTAPGRWTALCPAHDDNRPSLHVAEKDDGTLLLHCFSHQCGAVDIVAAVGLSLSDLFPERRDHHGPAGRPRIPAGDILTLLAHEAAVIEVAAADLANGFDLSPPDLARVQIAAQRIQDAWRLAYAH